MKILNLVIGLAIVIVLSGLFTLGIRAFYPAPEAPSTVILTSPPYCSPSEDKEKCGEKLKMWEGQYHTTKAEYDSLVEKYNQEVKEYKRQVQTRNRDIFIIGNIVGVLLFIAGFMLTKFSAMTSMAVGIGTILSGLYATIAGYTAGWDSTDDRLKFAIGFVIAVIIVGGSLWIGRYRKDKLVDKDNISVPPQSSQ